MHLRASYNSHIYPSLLIIFLTFCGYAA